MKDIITNAEGRVLPPLLLYMVGVPGFICIVLWVFFFKGN